MISLVNGSLQSPGGFAVPRGTLALDINVDATVVSPPYGFVLANNPIFFSFDAQGSLESGAEIYSNAELFPQVQLAPITGSRGPQAPASGISVAGSDVAWTNPSYITLDAPSLAATVTLNNQSSQLLEASAYGFNLPADAVVQGIEISIKGTVSSTTVSIPSFDNEFDTTGTGTSVSVGPLTPSTGGGEWALFSLVSSGGATFTPDPSWTHFDEGMFRADFGLLGQFVAGATPTTATGTLAASEAWAGALAFFILKNGVTSPTIVQSLQHRYGNDLIANGGTTDYVATKTLTAGNALMVICQIEATQGGTLANSGFTVRDSLGNDYILVASVQNTGGFGPLTQIYFAPNITGGSCTQTITAFDASGQLVGQFDSIEASGFATTPGPHAVVIPAPNTVTVTPINPAVGAETATIHLTTTPVSHTRGSATDLWGMPGWGAAAGIAASDFGFDIAAEISGTTGTVSISEAHVTVYYKAPVLGLGTFYYATIFDSNGAQLSTRLWQFSQANGATVDISQQPLFGGL